MKLGGPGPPQPPRGEAPDTGSPKPLLVLATLNRAKGRELADLLRDVPFRVVMLPELTDAPLPEETESTYEGNARLKARAAARLTRALALGDDSGLEVDALGGAPGIRSARYGGAGLTDAERIRVLLDALEGVPAARRTARFRAVIVLADPAGEEQVVQGVVDGVIADAPRGSGGFGYDPVFLYPPLGRTFAELTPEAKATISHRGIAAAAVSRLLGRCYTPDAGSRSGCGAAW